MPSRSALGALPRTGAGEARERGRRPLAHAAGLWPACGRDARAPRGWPCERCSWERGPLARTGPKARKAPTGATRPSRLLPRAGHTSAGGAQCRRGRPWVPCRGRALEKPESVGVARLAMWRAFGPLAGGTPALPGCGPVSDVLGARASGPHRAEGPQSADRSDTPEPATPPSRLLPRAGHTPEPATPPPEAPNAVEVGLGCPAEDGRWRSPRAWASPAWRCGGPAARLRAGRPRSQGVAL